MNRTIRHGKNVSFNARIDFPNGLSTTATSVVLTAGFVWLQFHRPWPITRCHNISLLSRNPSYHESDEQQEKMTLHDAKIILVNLIALIMAGYFLVNAILNSIAFLFAIPEFFYAGTLAKELWLLLLSLLGGDFLTGEYRRSVKEWRYERKVEQYYKPEIERVLAKHTSLTEDSKRALRELMLCFPEAAVQL